MISPVVAPIEILGSYTKVNLVRGELEIHHYESVSGSLPRHVIEYKIYTSEGKIDQGGNTPSVDLTV